MVKSDVARKDVDRHLLTKTVTYRKKEDVVVDYATDEKKSQYIEYEVPAQCTIQRVDSEMVEQGNLQTGDLIALLRYEYVEEADGTQISPALTPSERDQIVYLNNKFEIQERVPLTSEDSGIIGWEITATRVDENEPS